MHLDPDLSFDPGLDFYLDPDRGPGPDGDFDLEHDPYPLLFLDCLLAPELAIDLVDLDDPWSPRRAVLTILATMKFFPALATTTTFYHSNHAAPALLFLL